MSSTRERLDALYAIGDGPGANRPAYTAAEDEAHGLVADWMREADLEVTVDAAGNLFGRRAGSAPDLPEVWTGSHLDTVPNGGRYDGALGVAAALAAVERLSGLERTIAVVAWRDEEGWRFGRGCFGSRAICGALEPGELDAVDADGITLAAALGRRIPAEGWLARPPGAFVEAHVEQGPVLDRLGAPLGVVDSIVGLARLAVTFSGSPGHAGTTPMAGRRDALCEAAALVLAVRDAAAVLDGAVATVGGLTVEPGAANVIPARVRALVDARARTEGVLAGLVSTIERAAGRGSVEVLRRASPVPMAAVVQDALQAAIAELGLEAPVLSSGAGHDAGALGAAGVPSGLLFVRSRAGGVSHAPEEATDDVDVALCVDALAGTLKRLASASP